MLTIVAGAVVILAFWLGRVSGLESAERHIDTAERRTARALIAVAEARREADHWRDIASSPVAVTWAARQDAQP